MLLVNPIVIGPEDFFRQKTSSNVGGRAIDRHLEVTV